jgi:hypothetical protein
MLHSELLDALTLPLLTPLVVLPLAAAARTTEAAFILAQRDLTSGSGRTGEMRLSYKLGECFIRLGRENAAEGRADIERLPVPVVVAMMVGREPGVLVVFSESSPLPARLAR